MEELNVIYKNNRKHYIVYCKKCGARMVVRNDYISKHKGQCASCNALNNNRALKHGDTNKRLYHIWKGLYHRRYKNHTPIVCNEWNNYLTFKSWALNNGYKENLTIDRIDNKGDYSPNNCQWITLELNAGKDKIIFNGNAVLDIYLLRKQMKYTQKQMATYLKVSRNTIQRSEKKAKEILKNEYI